MTLYQEIRAAGKSMYGKSLAATRHLDFNMLLAAKRMTLPISGKTLIFDGEVAQNAFMDFWFSEYRVQGKSLAESVDPVAAGLSPLETESLAACCQSRTSLFLADMVKPAEHQIRLRDLLAPEHPDVWLTDLGLSDSLLRIGLRPALFCRLLVVRGIVMTSGFSFLFDPVRVPGLLDSYHKRSKKVPPADWPEARFVFFFQKFLQFGEDQIYEDVV